MSTLRTGTQIVAICGLAMFAGVILTVARTLVPYWQSLSAKAFLGAFAQFNHLVPAAVAPVLLPTLLAVLGSVLLTWRSPRSRLFWLLAGACLLLVLALTALYFSPLNSAFAEQRVPTNEVAFRLHWWARIHSLRVALSTAAPILGLLAFASEQGSADDPQTKSG